jgi:tRNA(adenine34) deaminase
MSDHDEYFMRLALSEAKRAMGEGQIPVGAVIVRGENVVASGCRSSRSPSSLAHAEVAALETALAPHGSGKDMTAYVTLEPCIMCFGMLVHARVARIVFGLEDPYAGATHWPVEAMPLRNKTHPPLITAGVLRDESASLLLEYFQVTKKPCWRSRLNPLVVLCTWVGRAKQVRSSSVDYRSDVQNGLES